MKSGVRICQVPVPWQPRNKTISALATTNSQGGSVLVRLFDVSFFQQATHRFYDNIIPWQPCPLAAIRKRPDGLFGLCETFARLPEPSVTLAKPSQVSQAEGDRYLDGLTCSYRSVDINYHTSSSSSIVPPCMPSEWLS